VKAVKIIQDPETIRILTDLVRREILRLLAVQPMTGTQLAEKTALTKQSAAHHLKTLLKAGLIKVKYTKPGPHGIMEKYYAPTAKLFVEDWEKIPVELRRYFVHSHMERLRGMLSVFQLIGEKQGQNVEVTSDEIKGMAQEIEKNIAVVARKYEEMETDMDRETLIIRIYSETLRSLMAEKRWKNFFSKIGIRS